MATLARNKAMDKFRRLRRPVQVLQEDIPDGVGLAPELDETRQRIWPALAQLERTVHPLSFLVFCLRWLEGWSFVEIEDTLRLTAGQARVQNHRLLRKFRVLLETASTLAPAGEMKIPGMRETIQPAPR